MPTRSHLETLARHSGPWALLIWRKSPDPKAKAPGLLKYYQRSDDPLVDALTLLAGTALSVNVWSVAEQQFVATVRKGDVLGEPPTPAAVIEATALRPKTKTRGTEYAALPSADGATLPPTLRATFDLFKERGSATVKEVADTLGRSTDVVASHATRLKSMGLLQKED